MNSLRIAAVLVFGSVLASVASAGPIYINSDTGFLGTITTTGVYTNIGMTMDPNGAPVIMGDIAVTSSGALYGTSWNGSATELYSINTSNAALTLIGPTGAGPQATAALTFSRSGVLYAAAAGGTTDDLVTINTSTGTETVVGGMGLHLGANDLVFNTLGTVMYGVGGFGNELFTVDPSTGAATPIGTALVPVTGLVYTAGTLYGFGYDNHVYSIDTSTGAPTDLGLITGTPAGWGDAFGAALAPATVPEPFTMALCAGGLGLAFARRRKAKQG